MSVELILEEHPVWKRKNIEFYMKNRKAYFDEEDSCDLNKFESTPCISSDGRYYRIESNGEWIGELKVTPDCYEDKEELGVAIFESGHGYATSAIHMYIEKFAEKDTILAVVREKNPNMEKMKHILKNIGFIQQERMQDVNPVFKGHVPTDYTFEYNK